MELTYEKSGDYLIPNLIPNSEPEETLTKYGLIQRGIYSVMLMMGNLKAHCLKIQKQAEERMALLIKQMVKSEGVDKALKAADQMKWVVKMNNIKQSAEEIVLTELVYGQ